MKKFFAIIMILIAVATVSFAGTSIKKSGKGDDTHWTVNYRNRLRKNITVDIYPNKPIENRFKTTIEFDRDLDFDCDNFSFGFIVVSSEGGDCDGVSKNSLDDLYGDKIEVSKNKFYSTAIP